MFFEKVYMFFEKVYMFFEKVYMFFEKVYIFFFDSRCQPFLARRGPVVHLADLVHRATIFF